jgi:hypothetical protein
MQTFTATSELLLIVKMHFLSIAFSIASFLSTLTFSNVSTVAGSGTPRRFVNLLFVIPAPSISHGWHGTIPMMA